MKTLFILTLVSVMLFACGESTYHGTTTLPVPRYRHDDAGGQKKMIIQQVSLNLVVPNTDTLNAQLARLAVKYEGYVVTAGTEYSAIRVKAVNLELALKELSTLGSIKSKSVSGHDVTEEYHDYQIRFENATKARERYLELLSKAENVEATLKVEKELERLNGEIDLLKGKMGKLEHLSDYATINVDIRQKRKLGVLGHVFVTLYKGVKWLFVRD